MDSLSENNIIRYENDDYSLSSSELIKVTADEYAFLNTDKDWLCSHQHDHRDRDQDQDKDNDLNLNLVDHWLNDVFESDEFSSSKMTLMNKLNALSSSSVSSPSKYIDTRTFSRPRKSANKRESLFNGNITKMSTLYSPEDGSEDPNDTTMIFNKTFEMRSAKKSMANDTFTFNNNNDNDHDRTFSMNNNNIDNYNDVEKIARIQEEGLKKSCRSPSRSPTRMVSPSRTLSRGMVMDNQFNNTITKRYSPVRHHITSKTALALVDDVSLNIRQNMYDDDEYGRISPENSFLPPHEPSSTSTPMIPHSRDDRGKRNVNFSRDSHAPHIMPNVSNMRENSNYSYSKIGRSLPNITKRLHVPVPNGVSSHLQSSNNTQNHYGRPSYASNNHTSSRASSSLSNTMKMSSDSRLMMRNVNANGVLRKQPQSLTRLTSSPPPYQRQQPLAKVTGDAASSNRHGTTNLIRKSTFRVRNLQPSSSEEYVNDDGDMHFNNAVVNNDYDHNNTVTVSNSKLNAYNTNSELSILQKNSHHGVNSKIPGPKSNRSAIPVCGTRTALPVPSKHVTDHHDSNSWRNGCF